MFKNCRKYKECCALSSESYPGIHYHFICSLIAECKGYFSAFFSFFFPFLSVFGSGQQSNFSLK